jgi:hypothetical protein
MNPEYSHFHDGFEIPMIVTTKIMVVRVVMPGQCFGGASHLHFQDERVSQVRNQQKLSLLPHSAGFLLGLLSYPEDGGSIFLLNDELPPNYMALQPGRLYSFC